MNLLPDWHYASRWPAQDIHRPVEELTELGIRFVQSSGPEKESLNLELLRAFHSYLHKYLEMIVRGRVPRYNGRINQDTKKLLMIMLPAGTPINLETLTRACRNLHLAFKGYEPAEVYNVLATILLKAISQYNPFYAEKVRKIAIGIEKMPDRKFFGGSAVTKKAGMESRHILRMLVKKGYLEIAERRGKESYYSVLEWPPSKLLDQGPIGLPYYVSQSFRYEFKRYVFSQMRQIESREEVLQLDHRHRTQMKDGVPGNPKEMHLVKAQERAIFAKDGGYQDTTGRRIAADVSMLNACWDISTMNNNWVQETTNLLFRDLTKEDRLLLQMVYKGDLSWSEIAKTFGRSIKEVQQTHANLLDRLREKVAA